MKNLAPGYIVSVDHMDGLYIVLGIGREDQRAVLLSRDGKQRILRGIPEQLIRIMPEQMRAWTSQSLVLALRKHGCGSKQRRTVGAIR